MSQTSQARLPALALTALMLLAPGMASPAEALVGQAAPDFALRSLEGANVRLSEHLGEVVLINFWATWCGPCRDEMPELDEIYGKYRRAGLVLFSVNLDEQSNLQAAREMATTLKVSYPVLVDVRKDVAKAYQTESVPLTVLIDREGVVRYVSEGYKSGYEVRYTDKLRELLNE